MYFSSIILLIWILMFDTVHCSPSKEKVTVRPRVTEDKLLRRGLITQFQNKNFFQDIFMDHVSPLEIRFGHVCENPKEWEQRFEQKNIKDRSFQGKIRWGNKNGQYGEHYWDLNH